MVQPASGIARRTLMVASLAASAGSTVAQCDSPIVNIADFGAGEVIALNTEANPTTFPSGFQATSSGDFNGDGLVDIVLMVTPQSNEPRRTYVLFGRPFGDPLPPTLNEFDFDGSFGISMFGISQFFPPRFVGDLNGDGSDDLAFPSCCAGFGRGGFIVFGEGPAVPSPAEQEVTSLVDGVRGFGLTDSTAIGGLDSRPSRTGDINGDGIDDLFLPTGYGSSGQALVVYGNADPGGFPSVIDASQLDGENGFVYDATASGFLLGSSSPGDINNDGIDDFMVRNPNRSRSLRVAFGRPASNPWPALAGPSDTNGASGVTIDDASHGVLPAGDVNGDGLNDVIVVRSDTTFSSVIFGRAASQPFPSPINAAQLDGTDGFTMEFPSLFAIRGVGDFNGDGIDDVAIGNEYAEVDGLADVGEVYIVFGRDSGTPFPTTISRDDLDGQAGLLIQGDTPARRFGASVVSAGDVNADGLADIAISYRVGGGTFIVLGRPNPTPTPPLADTNGDGELTPADFNAWVIAFNAQSDACDQNGDGACAPNDFNAWVLNFNAGC